MTFSEFKDIVLAEFGEIDGGRLEQFAALEAPYADWNSKINVISRKDMDNLYSHHVLHSLSIASYLRRECPALDEKLRRGASVLDLGTGGGFPGIPLAIMYPSSRFTLCDSVGKKLKVASAVAGEAGLGNVAVVNARAETLPEVFDVVVSRAVTSLENFYPWVKDKFSDSILYLKGGDINPEISELMRKFHLQKGCVRTWKVDSFLKDEYFAEKFVIHIEKIYLCNPKSEI